MEVYTLKVPPGGVPVRVPVEPGQWIVLSEVSLLLGQEGPCELRWSPTAHEPGKRLATVRTAARPRSVDAVLHEVRIVRHSSSSLGSAVAVLGMAR